MNAFFPCVAGMLGACTGLYRPERSSPRLLSKHRHPGQPAWLQPLLPPLPHDAAIEGWPVPRPLLFTLAKECLLGWRLQKEAGCMATPPPGLHCAQGGLFCSQAEVLDHCFRSPVLALVGANPSSQEQKSKGQVYANQGQSFRILLSLGYLGSKILCPNAPASSRAA